MAQYMDERGDVVDSRETQTAEKLTAREARQGMPGRPVLMVLIAALVLAAVAWAGAEMWGESTDRDASAPTATAPAANSNTTSTTTTPAVDNTPAAGDTQQMAPAESDPTPDSSTGGQSQTNTPAGTTNSN